MTNSNYMKSSARYVYLQVNIHLQNGFHSQVKAERGEEWYYIVALQNP